MRLAFFIGAAIALLGGAVEAKACTVTAPDSAFVSEMMSAPERRTAFVVGAGAYESAQDLPNATRDAADMARTLPKLGFEVFSVSDATEDALRACMDRFMRRADGSSVNLFYFAGHAVQIGAANFIVPTDGKVEDGGAIHFVPVSEIVDGLATFPGARLIFLDACRNNPWDGSAVAAVESRGVRRSLSGQVQAGLAVQEMSSAVAKSGSGQFIAFATAPGETAADGGGANSPFTAALLRQLRAPGVSVQGAMAEVTRDVEQATSRLGAPQIPWTRSSLTRSVYLNGELTKEALKTASDRFAETAQRLVQEGKWREAIAESLKGIPAHASPDDPSFVLARKALRNAAFFRSLRLDGTSNPIVNFNGALTRATTFTQSNSPQSFDLWDVEAGRLVARLVENTLMPLGMPYDFSESGAHVAALTRGGQVRIWNATTGAPLKTLVVPLQMQGDVNFINGDKAILLSDPNARHLLAFDIATGRQLWSAPIGGVLATYGANRTFAVMGSESGLRVVALTTGATVREFPNPPPSEQPSQAPGEADRDLMAAGLAAEMQKAVESMIAQSRANADRRLAEALASARADGASEAELAALRQRMTAQQAANEQNLRRAATAPESTGADASRTRRPTAQLNRGDESIGQLMISADGRFVIAARSRGPAHVFDATAARWRPLDMTSVQMQGVVFHPTRPMFAQVVGNDVFYELDSGSTSNAAPPGWGIAQATTQSSTGTRLGVSFVDKRYAGWATTPSDKALAQTAQASLTPELRAAVTRDRLRVAPGP